MIEEREEANMNDREFELEFERLIHIALPPIDVEFRERLLKDCLDVIGKSSVANELSDENLELLSAAGIISCHSELV